MSSGKQEECAVFGMWGISFSESVVAQNITQIWDHKVLRHACGPGARQATRRELAQEQQRGDQERRDLEDELRAMVRKVEELQVGLGGRQGNPNS